MRYIETIKKFGLVEYTMLIAAPIGVFLATLLIGPDYNISDRIMFSLLMSCITFVIMLIMCLDGNK